MSHLTQTVYNGRDNTIEIALVEDGTPIDHTVITRVVLEMSSGLGDLDSDVYPAAFNMGNADRLVMKLGHAGLPKGEFWASMVVYDAANPNGLRWYPDLHLVVEE